jgi:hypothetical protein
MGELISNPKAIVAFVQKLTDYCAVSNSILMEIETKVEDMMNDECDCWVEECYFYYETGEPASSQDLIARVTFHLSIAND